MPGKSRLVATTFLSSIVSMAAFACGNSATSTSMDEAESTGQASSACHHEDEHPCRSLTLTATRTYGAHPASHDASVSLHPTMHFEVPNAITVTTGNPGNGTATLVMKDGWREMRCTYRADKAHSRYKLDECDCWVGEAVDADALSLHIVDGDHAQTTTGIVTIAEKGYCHAPDAGADAGHPDASDASQPDTSQPDSAPACDPAKCDDGNPCTTDACGASGACTHASADDGTACNDANACTQFDVCLGGACTGLSPVTCSASDQCHAEGTCNPATGQCTNPAAADGTACTSGDLCVFPGTEACHGGVCGQGFQDCGGAECASTACNAATGQCSPSPAGTPCTGGACDGDYGCVPSAPAKAVTYLPPVCPPHASECTSSSGVFQASSLGCDYAPKPAGTACSSGICDGNNACVAVGTPPSTTPTPVTLAATCPPAPICANAGSIDFALGACAYVDLAAGTACGGGDTCDGHGSCTP